MSCSMSDMKVQHVIGRLSREFSTLDFIRLCPYSGGNEDATECPTVRSEGGRKSCCGRRLGEYSREHLGSIEQTNKGQTPARWVNLGRPAQPTASSDSPAGSGKSNGSGQSGLFRRQKKHQIAWKNAESGVGESGVHNGKTVDFLFPEDRWEANLFPDFRSDVLEHLERYAIQRHKYAHHVMSSQAFALNLAAPFLKHPEWLLPVFGDDVEEVLEVQMEVAGPKNYFREPGSRGTNRTSSDMGVWVRLKDGRKALHLIEVKFTESGFGECSKGAKRGGACDTAGSEIVGSDGASCPLSAPPHERTYWSLLRETGLFKPGALDAEGPCPFRHGMYQLMRNQLLAAVMEADPDCGVDVATFSLLLHDDNDEVVFLRQPNREVVRVDDAWPRLLRDPSRFGGIRSARAWVQAFADHPQLSGWAGWMLARYFPERVNEVPAEVAGDLPGKPRLPVVRAGHWDSIRWMASESFAAVKDVYDRAIGPGGVYFRPTNQGVVVIMLDDKAPGFVGFRTSHEDYGYMISSFTPLLDEESLRARHRAFQAWLPSVKRASDEERSVIPWIRRALQDRLVLPGMRRMDRSGGEWLFLNQEWRFVRDDGSGRKSDILAVHWPSRRLGIVEVKDSRGKRGEAIAQVTEYGRYWQRDAEALAPFFTETLNVMGRLYGNEWASTAVVSEAPAALFFARKGFLAMEIEQVG